MFLAEVEVGEWVQVPQPEEEHRFLDEQVQAEVLILGSPSLIGQGQRTINCQDLPVQSEAHNGLQEIMAIHPDRLATCHRLLSWTG